MSFGFRVIKAKNQHGGNNDVGEVLRRRCRINKGLGIFSMGKTLAC